MIVPPVGGLGAGAELGLGSVEGAGSTQSTGGSAAVGGGESGSFGSELTDAISSLEKTQQSSDSASQALATGTVKDPEAAVTTVEDAQMAMELASQLRTKATEAVQNIFQTQV
jgi:flagellar hook-basal body complex protein FliE